MNVSCLFPIPLSPVLRGAQLLGFITIWFHIMGHNMAALENPGNQGLTWLVAEIYFPNSQLTQG